MPATAKGNLVLTEPLSEVQVSRETVLELLENGYGPVNADGTLRRGHFFLVETGQEMELCGAQAWSTSMGRMWIPVKQ
jgi:hypothetical protein